MTEEEFRTARLFRVLGNPLRYKLLQELQRGPNTPTTLAKRVHRPLPAVSRALGILHWVGLVHYKTEGPCVIYSLPFPDVSTLLQHGVVFTLRHGLLVAPSPSNGAAGAPPPPDLRAAADGA